VPDAERARRAASALAQAQADARARGEAPVRMPVPAQAPSAEGASAGPGGLPVPPENQDQPKRGTAGGPVAPAGPLATVKHRRTRRDDPQPLTAAIDGLLDQPGWRAAAATGSVFSRWAEIVGPDLAAHTHPETLADGELTVSADSTAWATQVRLLAAQLVRRLAMELGDGAVRRVKVRGPAAPRYSGALRVRGARGPRDTYG
jgi:predicted nucleic acid-binding Zn ribbon protein